MSNVFRERDAYYTSGGMGAEHSVVMTAQVLGFPPQDEIARGNLYEFDGPTGMRDDPGPVQPTRPHAVLTLLTSFL